MDGEEANDRGGKRKTDEIFVEYYAFMFAAALKVLKQPADAEDVIQSLFFKPVDRELPPGVWEDPKGYLYRDLTPKVIDTGAVFISLDRLERGRLISSKAVKVEGYDEPQLVFSVTAEGKRMLSTVKAGAQQLLEALADFE